MQAIEADETDLQLIHLLQIAPRITWANAAEILQVSPGAAAARWTRIKDAGLAWMSVYPDPVRAGHVTAFVDLDCKPSRRREAVDQLCRDPRVVSLEECAGGRDFVLTIMAANLTRLSAYVVDELADIPGVTATRTRLVTALHIEGRHWRVGALDPAQQRQAAAAARDYPARSAAVDLRDHWPLVEALTRDARLPIADVARISGRNAATVRRHLGQLLASGLLSIRCDVAPVISGWPITCSWLVNVPPADQTSTINQLRTLSQLRMCASITGDANLIFTVYSRTLDGLSRFEEAVGQRCPGLQPLETLVHLRTHKRMGWLLDADGRCTRQLIVPNPYLSTPDS